VMGSCSNTILNMAHCNSRVNPFLYLNRYNRYNVFGMPVILVKTLSSCCGLISYDISYFLFTKAVSVTALVFSVSVS